MRFRIGEFEIHSVRPSFVKNIFQNHEDFSSHQDGLVHVVTFNSLMYLDAIKNPEFLKALRDADLIVAESSGIRWAVKFLHGHDIEVLPGVDLLCELFEMAMSEEVSFYFIGGEPGVAQMACKNVLSRWPSVKILGVRDGFGGLGLGEAGEAAACDEVARSDADVLIVGLGSPRQELFIHRHRARLARRGRLRVAVGVGGALDVLAGSVRRAPESFRKCGLEWMWRGIQEPRRLPRLARLPKFILEMIKLKLSPKNQLKYEP